jgi:hypothetical protein
MDSQHFDALTRLLGGGSRRHVLSALAAGLLAHVVRGPDADEVAAACKGFNAKCQRHGNCCADEGLRCVKVGKKKKGNKAKKRCRCKNGTCPDQTPCCIGGKCQELCDSECCADCFVPTDINGEPMPNDPVCCVGNAGTVCGPNPKKKSDDRCCYPEEECVNGKCCCDGCKGSIVCGGKCCAEDACCNGSCCPAGKVCAGNQCVSATPTRACGGVNPPCLAGEECHGGVCCTANRVCGDGELTPEVCCAVDEYCEMPNNECCPINTFCGAGSFKGHRVRR